MHLRSIVIPAILVLLIAACDQPTLTTLPPDRSATAAPTSDLATTPPPTAEIIDTPAPPSALEPSSSALPSFEPSATSKIAPTPDVFRITVTEMTKQAKVGSEASVSIKTAPHADCRIRLTIGGVVSKARGLGNKNAPPEGALRWTWQIDGAIKPGRYPLEISCIDGSQKQVYATTLEVVR